MIVPQNRLVLFTGFTLLPMSLVAAAAPAALPLLAGAGLAILFVCLFDALHIAGRCGKMRAEFPERVNLVRYRDQTLDFKVSDDNAVISTIYIALALPPEITSPKKEFLVTLPRNSTGLKIVWPVNGVERGEYLVSGCYYRAPSRLGFWCKQGCLEAQTRIRVYPDLLAEQRSISALFLRHGAAGCLARRQVGQGREFEQMRDYLPGDGMADIHWRVTAKRGRLVTKEYQLERTQEIYVLLDASRLSSRHIKPASIRHDGGREHLLDSYITAGLNLGDFAQRQGDRFGLIAFSDRVLSFIRAGRGRGHFHVCRDTLFDLHPRTVTPDFDELAALIMQNLRRRALLVFLTSLGDPSLAESFLSAMEAVSRRHLVLVGMIRPPQAVPLFSDPDVSDVADIYKRLGGHLALQNLRELEIALRRRAIQFFLVDHGKLCVEMVSHYMDVKRRQIL